MGAPSANYGCKYQLARAPKLWVLVCDQCIASADHGLELGPVLQGRHSLIECDSPTHTAGTVRIFARPVGEPAVGYFAHVTEDGTVRYCTEALLLYGRWRPGRVVDWAAIPSLGREALRAQVDGAACSCRHRATVADLQSALRVTRRHALRLQGLALAYLRTPDGGWGETEQAWRQLWSECSDDTGRCVDIVRRHHGTEVHPSRQTERSS